MNKWERGLEPTETEVNIQEWGLEFSVPNPLGQPPAPARCSMCVNDLCLPGPLLFSLYRIVSTQPKYSRTWTRREILSIIRELKQRRRWGQRERQKSSRFRLAKQQLCTCIKLFCTFLCRHCTTRTWKCLISRFVEDGNTRQQLSFSFAELWYSPLESASKKLANIQTIKGDGTSAIKFEAAQIHFLSDVFVAAAVVRCCLSSPVTILTLSCSITY